MFPKLVLINEAAPVSRTFRSTEDRIDFVTEASQPWSDRCRPLIENAHSQSQRPLYKDWSERSRQMSIVHTLANQDNPIAMSASGPPELVRPSLLQGQ